VFLDFHNTSLSPAAKIIKHIILVFSQNQNNTDWPKITLTTLIQQGAFRRGANMGMMRAEHPDILKFVYAKQNRNAFTNFNISVKIPDNWMRQLLEGGKNLHIVKNPRTQETYLLPRGLDIANYTINNLYKLNCKEQLPSEHAGRFYTIRDIWTSIIMCAHKTGEPGIAFIDRINRDNPTPSPKKHVTKMIPNLA